MLDDNPEPEVTHEGSDVHAALPMPSQPAHASYAFLNHSQDTLPNNLPPDVDNKPLARQKRRRTSPEDQATLEAEYLKDSKPDKAARLAIVSRVALGEKEVQIWFQNRRQNSRRKSRPVLPHEIQASLHARYLGANDVADVVREVWSPSQELCMDRLTDGKGRNGLVGDTAQTSVESSAATSSDPAEANKASKLSPVGLKASQSDTSGPSSLESISDVSQHSVPTAWRWSGLDDSFDTAATERSTFSSYVFSQTVNCSAPPEIGYLANRRSAAFANPAKHAVTHSNAPSLPFPDLSTINALPEDDGNQDRLLKGTTSVVRLSMTADGNAKVVTNDGLSPSPPRRQPVALNPAERNAVVRRSYSYTSLAAKALRTEADGVTPLSGRTKGRSRDSRAWEFWCDSDARSALAEKADQQQTGSAATAIESMRSGSRSSLTVNPNKRNNLLQRQSSAKRIRADSVFPAKPILSRAHTSLGRLQSDGIGAVKPVMTARTNDPEKPSKISPESLQSLDGDSDKENWEPGTRISAQRRRRLQHSTSASVRRHILGESGQMPSENSSLGVIMAREKVKSSISKLHERPGEADKENGASWAEDDEVARFMAQDRPGSCGSLSSVSGEEELGCVQGLLSLSQGSWR